MPEEKKLERRRIDVRATRRDEMMVVELHTNEEGDEPMMLGCIHVSIVMANREGYAAFLKMIADNVESVIKDWLTENDGDPTSVEAKWIHGGKDNN